MLRKPTLAVLLALTAGCALYNEVSIAPLHLLPANIARGADLAAMLRKADYLRAIEHAPIIESRPRQNPAELAALGQAYLAAGRYDDARTQLRAALELDPFRTMYADIAWRLSEVEYLANNYELSLEWAQIATERGLQVKPWHIDYLRQLANVQIYHFSGSAAARVPMHFGKPDVPRVTCRVNGTTEIDAIIDSGAVLSIVSRRFADQLQIKPIGDELEGTFYGLLGEPIQVHFGLLERIEFGDMVIENVPVAIMPDAKMRFLISRREGTEFRMDFLLGSNLLKEFRLELDFEHRKVGFTKLTARDRRPDEDQNLFFNGFRPYVRGTVNGRGWHLFILDTGSEITFLNESRIKSLPVQMFGARAHSATLQGLGGSMKRGAKIEDVEIGIDRWGGTFRTLPMYASDEKEPAVGIIGQNFLQKFNVVIDFGRMRVDLTRR